MYTQDYEQLQQQLSDLKEAMGKDSSLLGNSDFTDLFERLFTSDNNPFKQEQKSQEIICDFYFPSLSDLNEEAELSIFKEGEKITSYISNDKFTEIFNDLFNCVSLPIHRKTMYRIFKEENDYFLCHILTNKSEQLQSGLTLQKIELIYQTIDNRISDDLFKQSSDGFLL